MNLRYVFATVLVFWGVTSCSEKQVSIFETNQLRRLVGQTQKNQEAIAIAADECKRNEQETRKIGASIKEIKISRSE